MLPTVFKWEGGGKNVYISGTFSDWKTLPMAKRLVMLKQNYYTLTIHVICMDGSQIGITLKILFSGMYCVLAVASYL